MNTNKKKQSDDLLEKEMKKISEEEFKEINNVLRQLDLPMLHYMLSTTTDEKNTMSVGEIAEQFNFLIPSPIINQHFYSDRTVRRKLDDVIDFLYSNKNNEIIHQIKNILEMTMGGQIKFRNADGVKENKHAQKDVQRQRRYYFEPLLSASDMNMICGALRSSRYLSSTEKDYLLERLTLLHPLYNKDDEKYENNKYRHLFQIDALPGRPAPVKDGRFPFDSSTMLEHVQVIHNAIVNEHQIEVIYGVYDKKNNLSKMEFHASNKDDKAYILNPYALFWNNGDYYLVATHNNYTNPAHFRVDRIISVKEHKYTNKDGYLVTAKRLPVPISLKKYFIKEKGEKDIFNSIAYTTTYPDMYVYQEDDILESITFRCTPRKLQILVDTFGTNIELGTAENVLEKENIIDDADLDSYITATVKNVQRNNALRFSIKNSLDVTLIAPADLCATVKDTLQKIVDKY